MATQFAASLCRLIETPEARRTALARPSLIDAHVDAIRALVLLQCVRPFEAWSL